MSVPERTTPQPPPTMPASPPSAVDELSKPLPARVPRTRISGAWLRRLMRRGKS